jgi:hypothetical protein
LRIGLNTGAAVVGKVQEGADAQVTVLGDKPFLGVHKLLQGNIGEGIRVIEETVSRREREGHITNANFWRLNLAEVYLRIIAGNEKPSLGVLLKNLPILLKVMVTGSSRIRTLMARNREHPSDHPDSFHTGKVEMILGLLYKAKKKRALTVQHLTEAQRILSQFGQTPTLARVESGASGIGTIAPLRSVTNRLRATKPHQAHCTPPEAA